MEETKSQVPTPDKSVLYNPADTKIKPLVTVASIDTVEVFLRRPPKGLRTRIEEVIGQRAWSSPREVVHPLG